MQISLFAAVLFGSSHALTLGSVPAAHATRAAAPRMMFGGGGGDKKEGGGFMDQLKAAKDMFNPEMMNKYAEVGQKIQALQEELGQTEVECATNEGKIVVKVSGTSIPISIDVNNEMLELGAEGLSEALTSSVQQAHAKSGSYAQQRMGEVYEELGLNKGLAGMQQPGQ